MIACFVGEYFSDSRFFRVRIRGGRVLRQTGARRKRGTTGDDGRQDETGGNSAIQEAHSFAHALNPRPNGLRVCLNITDSGGSKRGASLQSFWTVSSFFTATTRSVPRAIDTARSISSWLFAVPLSHTTPSASVSTCMRATLVRCCAASLDFTFVVIAESFTN